MPGPRCHFHRGMKIKLNSTARSIINLYSTSFMMSFGHGMIIPTMLAMPGAFGVSLLLAAQMISALNLGKAVSPLPTGVLIDRLGTRWVMIMGPMILVSGAFLAVVATNFSLILLAMFLAGAGDSMWMNSREVAGVSLVRSEQRGRLMSGFMGISSSGMALGPLLGGLLTELVSFRAVFMLYTALAVTVLVVALVTASSPKPGGVKRSPGMMRGAIARGFFLWRHLVEWGRLFKDILPEHRATYAVLVFATTVMMFYRSVLQSMLPVYAAYLGYSPIQVGFLFSVPVIFVLVMVMPAGFITDKVGRKWASVPSTAIPGLAFLALPFVDGFPALLLISSIIGLAQGLSLGTMATSTYDVIPENGRGRLQALRRTISEVGGIGGPVMGGLVATAYYSGAPFLVVGPILLFASLLVAVVAKETLVKTRQPVVA